MIQNPSTSSFKSTQVVIIRTSVNLVIVSTANNSYVLPVREKSQCMMSCTVLSQFTSDILLCKHQLVCMWVYVLLVHIYCNCNIPWYLVVNKKYTNLTGCLKTCRTHSCTSEDLLYLYHCGHPMSPGKCQLCTKKYFIIWNKPTSRSGF